ncbi:hypothetical protein ACIQUF_07575 [Pseudomonas sp. NPDC090233]|uniref:hypothetical protein n=1 Tax=Pseudomonas sp. NPDC090233 TaxID=3364479 RepID=UPI00383BD92E
MPQKNTGIKGVYKKYHAIKEAREILQDCRADVVSFLKCKRLAVTCQVVAAVGRKSITTASSLAGSAAGSATMPVVGSFVGGELGKSAVESVLPKVNIVPDTNLAKNIQKNCQGFFEEYKHKQYWLDKGEDKGGDWIGDKFVTKGLELAGEDKLPMKIPFMWGFKTLKSISDATHLTKSELGQKLEVGVRDAELMIKMLNNDVANAFKEHAVLHRFRKLITDPPSEPQLALKVSDHPIRGVWWIPEWKAIEQYEMAIKQLDILKRLTIHISNEWPSPAELAQYEVERISA